MATTQGVAVPDNVLNSHTGDLLKDALPLVTMLSCVPSLVMFWSQGRRRDFACCLMGFALACGYHLCHLSPSGCGEHPVLGLPASTWRTLDIICVHYVMGRTVVHALDVNKLLLKAIHGVGYPAMVAYNMFVLPRTSLSKLGLGLVGIMLLTAIAKLVFEGWRSLPPLRPARVMVTVSLVVLAFTFFPLPAHIPGTYWLFHSLWHVVIAAAYHDLYTQLLSLSDSQKSKNL